MDIVGIVTNTKSLIGEAAGAVPRLSGDAAEIPRHFECPPEDCQPEIRAIADYWRRISPPERLPGRQHLEPLDIPKLLSKLWLLDVIPAPQSPLRYRFRVRLLGTEVASGFRRDFTGMWLDEAWPMVTSVGGTYPHYLEVVERAAPSFRRGKPTFDPKRDFTWMERILLPMARDGAQVDMILALTVFMGRPQL
jgi:hypothetical protein